MSLLSVHGSIPVQADLFQWIFHNLATMKDYWLDHYRAIRWRKNHEEIWKQLFNFEARFVQYV